MEKATTFKTRICSSDWMSFLDQLAILPKSETLAVHVFDGKVKILHNYLMCNEAGFSYDENISL
jgi:hypothetical protein